MALIFPLRRKFGNPVQSRRAVNPVLYPQMPLPSAVHAISGFTRDSSGVALGNCSVDLFFADSDILSQRTTSSVSGSFTFVVGPGVTFYMVAYLVGSPDVAGTTVNTLQGLQV